MNGLAEINRANRFKQALREQERARALNRGASGRLHDQQPKQQPKVKRP